jgi:hypothetical protein
MPAAMPVSFPTEIGNILFVVLLVKYHVQYGIVFNFAVGQWNNRCRSDIVFLCGFLG